MDKISNFKITEIEAFQWFFKNEATFGEKEMVLSLVIYFSILGVCWAIWKNWPNASGMMKTKRLLLWSPPFRCLMMTWFASALWVFTFFHGASDGFYSLIYDLKSPRVKGKGNGRLLGGLDTKYPTQVDVEFSQFIMPLVKVGILFAFPIISYIWLK